MGNFSVYCHTLKSDGRKYIGLTSQLPRKRWSYGSGYGKTTHIGAAIRKYGWNSFDHEILEEGLTEDEAKERECFYIAMYDTMNPEKGFNVTAGGDGVLHLKMTPETIEKLRKSHLGKRPSEETIRKRSQSLKEFYKTHPAPEVPYSHIMKMVKAREGKEPWAKGKHLSEQTKEKLRLANLGKKASEETKKKMRNSANTKKITVYDLDGNKLNSFPSIVEAASFYGARCTSHITECCKGRRKQYMNLKWKYYEQ